MIKAYKLENKSKNEKSFVEVYPVLHSMLSINPSAKYYSLVDANVVLYIPDYSEETEWIYIISGQRYKTLGTNSINHFTDDKLNYYKEKDIQLTIFDF